MGPSARAAKDQERPLLLLDVDGVLQPIGRSVPPGFQRFTTDADEVVLCALHGTWLSQLAIRFDLVWVTTWGASANQSIGARLGLPELPHVDLVDLPRVGTRKLTAVKEFVGSRAVAWVDDELYEDAVAWAAQRSVPTLLLRTRGSVGLTLVDVEALELFVESLATDHGGR